MSGFTTKRRMSRDRRHNQLLEVAYAMIRSEGTDALTLARVAERAGVSKPIAYGHFGTRAGLLSALYRAYDERQTEVMRTALERAKSFRDTVTIISAAYVDCAIDAGPEISAITAALSGSDELDEVLQSCRDSFMEECRSAFAPFVPIRGQRGQAALIAIVGVSDALSHAAAAKRISRVTAIDMLSAAIDGMLREHRKNNSS